MTDERLDQILKQALAPEIADTEIAVKQAGRNYYMKKLWKICLLYTSPSPRDLSTSRMPSSA